MSLLCGGASPRGPTVVRIFKMVPRVDKVIYECYFCEKVYSYKSSLLTHVTKKHILKAEENKKINKMKGAENKAKERKINDAEEPIMTKVYLCKTCDSESESKENLKNHICICSECAI